MGRVNKRGTTVREWCATNNNYNLINSWDIEKNGDNTPDVMMRYSNAYVHLKCHVCGREFTQRLRDYKCKNGCYHCKGNKYVDLGRNGDYTVYCHITPDGKRYVGFTGSPIKIRFGNGKYYTGGRFKKAIDLFGWNNIEHVVLEHGLTKEEASEKEIYYINLYQTLDERYGYNVSTGGIHGYRPIKHSKETIEKIRRSNLGKKIPIESRIKMSMAHIGKDNHKSKEICKIDKKGVIVAVYPSCKDAAVINNCNYKNISRCACGTRKTYKGFSWRYKKDMED